MSKSPLVSVIIPVYNVEGYLKECFESVVAQTYENIEIILVNDGSTDSSGKIADMLALGESRASVIHKKNGGLSDARNRGLEAAKGKYVTFIDSDDYVDKTFVEKLLKLTQETGADIAQCDNTRTPRRLGRGTDGSTVLSGPDAFLKLMKYRVVSPTAWGKLYRASLFRDNNLFFPVARIHEDTALLYKLVYCSDKVACLNRALYYYRKNENSIMTAKYSVKHYGSVVQYFQELDEFITKNNISIKNSMLNRHKALRLLSILNKLSLSNEGKSKDYAELREKYIQHSIRSQSFSCILGSFFVFAPTTFRATKAILPTIRSMLGKS